jgi:hypothetical protein
MDYRTLAASLAASLAAASSAMAATAPASETGRIASQYSSWAGSRANAEALVSGLRNGSTITLATTGSDNTLSLAGFTPAAPMSVEDIAGALARAQRELARVGIARPTAEQIHAALVGGEIPLHGGRNAKFRGSVAARSGNAQIASR